MRERIVRDIFWLCLWLALGVGSALEGYTWVACMFLFFVVVELWHLYEDARESWK